MKNRIRRLSIIAMMTIFFILASVVAISSQTITDSKKGFNVTGYPIVKDPITITIVAQHDIAKGQKKYSEMDLFKKLEKKTNIKINWIEIPGSAWAEKKNLIFASGDLPDAFWGNGIDDTDIISNMDNLVPLNDLIDKYAPNIKKIFNVRPETKTVVTAYNENIYSLFQVRETYFPATRTVMGINKKWLDKLGLQIPKTTDELLMVLRKFKSGDPNGNGKQDEIPLTFMYAMGSGSVRNPSDLFPPFGVYDNTSNSVLTYHLMTRNKEVIFTPIDLGYKEAMKWLNKLYSEGLLDKEAYTHTQNTYYAKTRSMDDLVGVVVDWTINSAVGSDRERDFVQLPPLSGPKGDKGWTVVSGSQIARNKFLITKKNKYPEATMRWVDEFYEPYTSLETFCGPIGQMYTLNAKGVMVPTVPPKDMNFESWKWGNAPADSAPFAALKEYESMILPTESQIRRYNAELVVQPYLQKDPYPNFFFSNDDTEALKEIMPEINSYVQMMQANFVTDGGIDAKWDNYVQNLKNMRLDEAMAIFTRVYKKSLTKK